MGVLQINIIQAQFHLLYNINLFKILLMCSEIWKYLEHLAGLLKNIATALCSIPSEEEGYVKNQLSSSNRRRNSFSSQSPQYPGSRLPRGIATGIQHVTGQSQTLHSIIILFFFRTIIICNFFFHYR